MLVGIVMLLFGVFVGLVIDRLKDKTTLTEAMGQVVKDGEQFLNELLE